MKGMFQYPLQERKTHSIANHFPLLCFWNLRIEDQIFESLKLRHFIRGEKPALRCEPVGMARSSAFGDCWAKSRLDLSLAFPSHNVYDCMIRSWINSHLLELSHTPLDVLPLGFAQGGHLASPTQQLHSNHFKQF